MTEDFDDEQIRSELKKLVEDLRSTTIGELSAVQSEAASANGATPSQLQNLKEKLEQKKREVSLRAQQMIDFINRR